MFSKQEATKNLLMTTKMILQGIGKTKRFLNNVERGEFRISIDYMGEERFMKGLRRDINRLSMSILTLGFMLSSSLLILALSPHLLKEYFVYPLAIFTILLVFFLVL